MAWETVLKTVVATSPRFESLALRKHHDSLRRSHRNWHPRSVAGIPRLRGRTGGNIPCPVTKGHGKQNLCGGNVTQVRIPDPAPNRSFPIRRDELNRRTDRWSNVDSGARESEVALVSVPDVALRASFRERVLHVLPSHRR